MNQETLRPLDLTPQAAAVELKNLQALAAGQQAALAEIAQLLVDHPEFKRGNSKVHYCAHLALAATSGSTARPADSMELAKLQAQRAELLAALRKVSTCLSGWLEIADEEDQRDYDKEALEEAYQAIKNAEGNT